MHAQWQGQVVARSDATVVLEGNHYFPIDSVDRKFLQNSATLSYCPWKGKAQYYNIVVDGKQNTDAAWYYPDPNPEAQQIKNYVAFWRGVTIAEDG